MKMLTFILFSFAFCQSYKIAFDLNQIDPREHLIINFQNSIMLDENRHLVFNYNNNYGFSNWFYSMGPYNDTWGSDILKVYNLEGKRPRNYYPFNNSTLSFQSKGKSRYTNENVSTYINVLGFNLKRLNNFNIKNRFYGSE